MCGIVGYITAEAIIGGIAREKFLSQAIIAGTLRGADSTGIFTVDTDNALGGSPGWCKEVTDGYSFVEGNKAYREIYSSAKDVWASIAHNRSATVGGLKVDAAHPFQVGPITLVHNGTLWDTTNLPITQYAEKIHNDSHCIAHNLAAVGVDEVEKVIKELQGAFALIWHDNRDNALRLVRNTERPLHLATVHDQNTIFIASEADMLSWLISRNKMSVKQMAYPKPGQLMTFQHGETEPVITEVELAEDSYTAAYTGGWQRGKKPAPYVDRTPPKLPAPASYLDNLDNGFKIMINGDKKEIPTRAQEMLFEEDYLIEDKLIFVPSHTLLGRDGRMSVMGRLEDDGVMAVVHGLPTHFAEENVKKKAWVVRPIVPNFIRGSYPVLTCKVVSLNPDSVRDVRYAKETAELHQGEEDDEDVMPTDMVLGPNACYLTEDQYKGMTQAGCICCGGNLALEDADEIIWVNNYIDPLCAECCEDYYGMNYEQGVPYAS